MGLFSDIYSRVSPGTTVAGPSVDVGRTTVTSLARVLVAKRREGVWMRARPAAVLVSIDGKVSRIRIRDTTRVARTVIVFLSVLLPSLLIVRSRGRKEKKQWMEQSTRS